MTRKRAIEIVVKNVKMGWVNIDWTHAEIRRRMGSVKILFEVCPESTTTASHRILGRLVDSP